jgi:hypothetical protein
LPRCGTRPACRWCVRRRPLWCADCCGRTPSFPRGFTLPSGTAGTATPCGTLSRVRAVLRAARRLLSAVHRHGRGGRVCDAHQRLQRHVPRSSRALVRARPACCLCAVG